MIGVPISNAAVDNAARSIADRTLQQYVAAFPDDPPPLTTRDPAHCLDLLAKDFGKLQCMKPFLDDLGKVVSLLTNNQIIGICENAVYKNQVESFTKVVKKSETRFYAIADEIASVLKNKNVLAVLPTLKDYEEHLRTRKRDRKETLDNTMDLINAKFWRTAEFLKEVFGVLKSAVTMVSGEKTPMSAYLPICCATKLHIEEVLKSVNGKEGFESMFGMESFEAFNKCVSTRVNLDGLRTPGQKMELLDPYQIWCYLVDPFRGYLCWDMAGIASIQYFTEALDFYMPVLEGGKNQAFRRNILQEYDSMMSMSGLYAFKYQAYGKPDFEEVTPLSFTSIQSWVNEFGGANGRLNFFTNGLEKTMFFQRIALPLLSMKTTGSITVERAAKPLKNGVLEAQRNRLSVHKQILCLRAGLNLKMKADMEQQAKSLFH